MSQHGWLSSCIELECLLHTWFLSHMMYSDCSVTIGPGIYTAPWVWYVSDKVENGNIGTASSSLITLQFVPTSWKTATVLLKYSWWFNGELMLLVLPHVISVKLANRAEVKLCVTWTDNGVKEWDLAPTYATWSIEILWNHKCIGSCLSR